MSSHSRSTKMKIIFEDHNRVFCSRVCLVDCDRRCKLLDVSNTTRLPKTNEGICQYLSLSSVCDLNHFANHTPFQGSASCFQDWPPQSVEPCHWAGSIFLCRHSVRQPKSCEKSSSESARFSWACCNSAEIGRGTLLSVRDFELGMALFPGVFDIAQYGTLG